VVPQEKKWNDGFKQFHHDYESTNGGHNAVSSTIDVNLGVFHSEDKDKGEEEEEEESEDEEYNVESMEEGVLFAASNSPDQPERMMPAD
jgi:hypothetical protein